MAGSVNKVILVGNLGKDAEVRSTQAGGKIVNLTVATSEQWTDKASGERKEKTEWHRVVIFNERVADAAERYARKGRKVYIEGALQTRKWTDQSGVERYSTEIIITAFRGEMNLLDRNPDADEQGGQRQGSAVGKPAAQPGRSNNGGAPPVQSGGYRGDGMSGRAAAASGGGGGWGSGDLDDEIPFGMCWQ